MKNIKSREIRAVSIILSVIFLGIIWSGITFMTFSGEDKPPTARYHVLNAAIKNTCYLDPQRNHCPQTAKEVIDIEGDHFTSLTKDANLTYQYYADTNDYTLIVRNNDLENYNNRVAVFDSRLPKANTNQGFDFYDAQVQSCNGHYKLVNPPQLAGPWDQIN